MSQSINFHGIVSLRLTEIDEFDERQASSGKAFATRDLEIIDADGNHYFIGLFATDASRLRVTDTEHRAAVVAPNPLHDGCSKTGVNDSPACPSPEDDRSGGGVLLDGGMVVP